MTHPEIIKLVIGYTAAGVFAFTAFITCLSLVGWIKFADKGQQRKLFYVLIVEVVVTSVTYFSGLLNFNTAKTAQLIGTDAITETGWEFIDGQGEARVNALLDNVGRLSDSAVIALENKLPVDDPEIAKVVELRDPKNQRLIDADIARRMLKMRAVLASRDVENLTAWETAVHAAERSN